MATLQRFAIPGLSIFIAFVFIQSLFFKYTDAVETQHIFGVLDQWAADAFGAGGLFAPTGLFSQYVIGTAELVASVMLLTGLMGPTFYTLQSVGALLGLAIMTGAISFHLMTPLGIVVQDDGGTLFIMACGVWLSALIILIARGVALGRIGRIFAD